MAAFSFRDSYDDYSRMNSYAARMEREQQMLQKQMRQMQDMMQQQMYPMYQMDSTTATTATNATTGFPSKYGGEWTVMTNPYMESPRRKEKCSSCGEEQHRQRNLKNGECDRTIGLRVKKQAENFRKLYWHRRMMNPERFEKTT